MELLHGACHPEVLVGGRELRGYAGPELWRQASLISRCRHSIQWLLLMQLQCCHWGRVCGAAP